MSKTERHTYYLVGATGFPNYGDELIAAGWLRYLARHDPGADVWLDCHSPGNAQLLLGHLHPRVRFVDTLWRVCWAAPSEDTSEMAAFAVRAAEAPGLVPRYVAGLELLRDVDVVHIIGGGYINGIWPRHIGLLAAAGAVARRFCARAAMTGAGLVPLVPGSATLVRRLALDFDVVDVRDGPSWEALDGVAARTQSGDDAFLDLDDHLFDVRPSPEVMVCAQSDLVEGGVSRLAELAVDALRERGVAGDRVGYVECIPGPDRTVFDLVEPYLPGVRFYPFSEVWRHGLPARPGQWWLSTRFHPHLLAAAAGASGVAVPIRKDYYEIKHRSLADLGSGWAIATEPTDVPQVSDAGWAADALEKLTAAKLEVARAVYPTETSGAGWRRSFARRR